jgi:hypothetical protein
VSRFPVEGQSEAPVASKRGKDACKVVEKDGDDSVVIGLAAPEGDVPG